MAADVPDLDRDSPIMRATCARLAGNLAGQLSTVAGDLDGASAPPWQCCDLMRLLSECQQKVAIIRREVSKFKPADDEPAGDPFN